MIIQSGDTKNNGNNYGKDLQNDGDDIGYIGDRLSQRNNDETKGNPEREHTARDGDSHCISYLHALSGKPEQRRVTITLSS